MASLAAPRQFLDLSTLWDLLLDYMGRPVTMQPATKPRFSLALEVWCHDHHPEVRLRIVDPDTGPFCRRRSLPKDLLRRPRLPQCHRSASL